jgi:predicted HTH transcriptional regulator
MNLFKLRKMASDGDMSVIALRYLLGCHGECEYLDYKEKLNLNTDYDKACFARDLLAMKNVGGGYIVLGVKNQTWEPIGLKQPIKVDTKILRDLVRKVTGLELEIDIVAHTMVVGLVKTEIDQI